MANVPWGTPLVEGHRVMQVVGRVSTGRAMKGLGGGCPLGVTWETRTTGCRAWSPSPRPGFSAGLRRSASWGRVGRVASAAHLAVTEDAPSPYPFLEMKLLRCPWPRVTEINRNFLMGWCPLTA